MANAVAKAQTISVDRVFLDLDNPRHKPYKTESEVIEYLCREEYVFALAKDIVKLGLNPLELFALIPLDKEKGARRTFMVAEGNRRMCAIKLLHDPDLAPAKLRKDFAKLAEGASDVSHVLGVEFQNKEQVDVWLERIHGGVQAGVGRKPWNSEQKTRHIGDKKNVLAQVVLDYAEKRKFISADQRKGKLTTAQRYLGNTILREMLGLESSSLEDVSRTRPAPDFDLLLETFTRDLINGEVHSRSNSDEIKDYARTLGMTPGLTATRTLAEPLSLTAQTSKKRRITPTRPDKQKHVTYEPDIAQNLKAIPSYKLERIYYSICEISLEDHTPLVAVGTWSFLECLTARCGRSPNSSFLDYLNKNKLNLLGYTQREDVNSIRQALERIAHYGNTTKHHETAATFNGPQLANDMDTLKGLIVKLAVEAKNKGN